MNDLNENEGQVDYAFAFGYLRSKVQRLIDEELLDEVLRDKRLKKKFREAVAEARLEGQKHFKQFGE